MSEEMYTPQEVAAAWKISLSSVRRLFRNEKGVIDVSSRPKTIRRRTEIRIPKTVLERVQRERARA